MHFYGWKAGLKTGMYYLRTRPAAQAIQFTVDTELLKEVKATQAKAQAASVKKPKASSAEAPVNAALPVASVKEEVVGTVEKEVIVPSEDLPLTPSTSAGSIDGSAPAPLTELSASKIASTSSTPSGLDERTAKAAEQDPEFAAALQRQRDREYEQAKLMCSIENKEACLMCSG